MSQFYDTYYDDYLSPEDLALDNVQPIVQQPIVAQERRATEPLHPKILQYVNNLNSNQLRIFANEKLPDLIGGNLLSRKRTEEELRRDVLYKLAQHQVTPQQFDSIFVRKAPQPPTLQRSQPPQSLQIAQPPQPQQLQIQPSQVLSTPTVAPPIVLKGSRAANINVSPITGGITYPGTLKGREGIQYLYDPASGQTINLNTGESVDKEYIPTRNDARYTGGIDTSFNPEYAVPGLTQEDLIAQQQAVNNQRTDGLGRFYQDVKWHDGRIPGIAGEGGAYMPDSINQDRKYSSGVQAFNNDGTTNHGLVDLPGLPDRQLTWAANTEKPGADPIPRVAIQTRSNGTLKAIEPEVYDRLMNNFPPGSVMSLKPGEYADKWLKNYQVLDQSTDRTGQGYRATLLHPETGEVWNISQDTNGYMLAHKQLPNSVVSQSNPNKNFSPTGLPTHGQTRNLTQELVDIDNAIKQGGNDTPDGAYYSNAVEPGLEAFTVPYQKLNRTTGEMDTYYANSGNLVDGVGNPLEPIRSARLINADGSLRQTPSNVVRQGWIPGQTLPNITTPAINTRQARTWTNDGGDEIYNFFAANNQSQGQSMEAIDLARGGTRTTKGLQINSLNDFGAATIDPGLGIPVRRTDSKIPMSNVTPAYPSLDEGDFLNGGVVVSESGIPIDQPITAQTAKGIVNYTPASEFLTAAPQNIYDKRTGEVVGVRPSQQLNQVGNQVVRPQTYPETPLTLAPVNQYGVVTASPIVPDRLPRSAQLMNQGIEGLMTSVDRPLMAGSRDIRLVQPERTITLSDGSSQTLYGKDASNFDTATLQPGEVASNLLQRGFKVPAVPSSGLGLNYAYQQQVPEGTRVAKLLTNNDPRVQAAQQRQDTLVEAARTSTENHQADLPVAFTRQYEINHTGNEMELPIGQGIVPRAFIPAMTGKARDELTPSGMTDWIGAPKESYVPFNPSAAAEQLNSEQQSDLLGLAKIKIDGGYYPLTPAATTSDFLPSAAQQSSINRQEFGRVTLPSTKNVEPTDDWINKQAELGNYNFDPSSDWSTMIDPVELHDRYYHDPNVAPNDITSAIDEVTAKKNRAQASLDNQIGRIRNGKYFPAALASPTVYVKGETADPSEIVTRYRVDPKDLKSYSPENHDLIQPITPVQQLRNSDITSGQRMVTSDDGTNYIDDGQSIVRAGDLANYSQDHAKLHLGLPTNRPLTPLENMQLVHYYKNEIAGAQEAHNQLIRMGLIPEVNITTTSRGKFLDAKMTNRAEGLGLTQLDNIPPSDGEMFEKLSFTGSLPLTGSTRDSAKQLDLPSTLTPGSDARGNPRPMTPKEFRENPEVDSYLYNQGLINNEAAAQEFIDSMALLKAQVPQRNLSRFDSRPPIENTITLPDGSTKTMIGSTQRIDRAGLINSTQWNNDPRLQALTEQALNSKAARYKAIDPPKLARYQLEQIQRSEGKPYNTGDVAIGSQPIQFSRLPQVPVELPPIESPWDEGTVDYQQPQVSQPSYQPELRSLPPARNYVTEEPQYIPVEQAVQSMHQQPAQEYIPQEQAARTMGQEAVAAAVAERKLPRWALPAALGAGWLGLAWNHARQQQDNGGQG